MSGRIRAVTSCSSCSSAISGQLSRFRLPGCPAPCLNARPCQRTIAASATSAPLPRDLQDEVKKAVSTAERAMDTWQLETSDFVSPPVTAEVKRQVGKWADVECIAWGGFQSAERCRLVFGREEVTLAVKDDLASLECVRAMQVQGQFMFDAASHRDFLGAILGTGIERRMIGDVLVQGDRGAQLLCAPEMVDHIGHALTQVKKVPVETAEIPLADLKVPKPTVQEVSSVEASMRVDAVASAGFKMSRAKMLAAVKNGDVRVNWLPCSKPAMEVEAGDLIACAGKGRVEVREVSQTKKGKFAVNMIRFT